MFTSIVIPAWNEEHKIICDVEIAADFLKRQDGGGEILVVDDGSFDRTAENVRTARVTPGVEIRLLGLEKNFGKGMAVKTGILASLGDVIIVADAGSCVPYSNALPSMKRIRSDELDIGLGSRRHAQTVIKRNRTVKRRILSRLFHGLAVLFSGLPARYSDSQCGFKVYRGDSARALFSECGTSGYLFEIEILLRAERSGLRIEEFPVEWSCDPDSRLRPGAEAPALINELFQIRRRLKKP